MISDLDDDHSQQGSSSANEDDRDEEAAEMGFASPVDGDGVRILVSGETEAGEEQASWHTVMSWTIG